MSHSPVNPWGGPPLQFSSGKLGKMNRNRYTAENRNRIRVAKFHLDLGKSSGAQFGEGKADGLGVALDADNLHLDVVRTAAKKYSKMGSYPESVISVRLAVAAGHSSDKWLR